MPIVCGSWSQTCLCPSGATMLSSVMFVGTASAGTVKAKAARMVVKRIVLEREATVRSGGGFCDLAERMPEEMCLRIYVLVCGKFL